LLAGSRRHPLPHRSTNVDPVQGLVVERPVEFDVDPNPTQMIDNRVGDVRALVTAHCHSHLPRL